MQEILLHHAVLPDALPEPDDDAWGRFVSGPVAARVALLRDPAARHSTLLGLLLLRDCARAAGLRVPAATELAFPAGRKPRWCSGPDFSISHAGGRVACALAPPGIRIGLDIERGTDVTWQDLRLVMREAEFADYTAAGLDPATLWTAKEATLKAAGASVVDLATVRAGRDLAQFDGEVFRLSRPSLAQGFACAVASSEEARVLVREVDVRILFRGLA